MTILQLVLLLLISVSVFSIEETKNVCVHCDEVQNLDRPKLIEKDDIVLYCEGVQSMEGNSSLGSFFDRFPKPSLRLAPTINFKFKQRLSLFGASVAMGFDYLSALEQWRAHFLVEDTLLRGRFSVRGSELGWTKAWNWNLGFGEEANAKFKLRMGVNLNTWKAYVRLKFRTEPVSVSEVGDGISCAGKLPLTLMFPVINKLPLRVEYRWRIDSLRSLLHSKLNRFKLQDKMVVSTEVETLDISLEELNFCLEWDEYSPVWNIGVVKNTPSYHSSREISSQYADISPFGASAFSSPSSTNARQQFSSNIPSSYSKGPSLLSTRSLISKSRMNSPS